MNVKQFVHAMNRYIRLIINGNLLPLEFLNAGANRWVVAQHKLIAPGAKRPSKCDLEIRWLAEHSSWPLAPEADSDLRIYVIGTLCSRAQRRNSATHDLLI
jgi:hypothetical protein